MFVEHQYDTRLGRQAGIAICSIRKYIHILLVIVI